MRARASALLCAIACASPGRYVWVEDYGAAATASDYTLGPGDVIFVRVFNQEAVSGRLRVRPDGRITVPFLNDVEAQGQTPVALAHLLQVRLKDFINVPVVTVSVEEPRGLQISLVGEIAKPGTYQLEAGSGLLQAIAAAGGLTDFAHRDRIFVVRGQQPEPVRVRFTWQALARAEGKAAVFRMQPGDVVVAE